MNAKTYEMRRDELVKLIDKALDLGNIPYQTRLALEAVRRKVFENQFRIVLVSEFETGKSTTFNMICGGQEVSPRGAMSRTSATVISVQNTTDDSLVGKASIIWRSDRELTMVFAKALTRYFKELDPERFRNVKQSEELCEELRYPADIPLLKRAIRKRLTDWKNKNGQFDKEEEVVKIAYLIAEHYSDPWLLALKGRTEFDAAEIAEMVCFPQHYLSRDWKTATSCPFSVRESVFAFIRQAHCLIRSESLARTGSVLIDCPGLFASTYDTTVAFEVLENADAVWYILGGRGLGEHDREAIMQINTAKPGCLIPSVNLINNNEARVRSDIIPDYEAFFRDIGMNAAAKDVYVYNALLGVVTAQARLRLAGKMDQHTSDAIMDLASRTDRECETLEEALNEAAVASLQHRHGIGRNALRSFDLFSADGRDLAMAEEKSGMARIVAAVENVVVAKKARSILVDNGAKKAIALISAVESELKTAERVAMAGENKMKAQFNSARQKIEKFETYCEDRLKDLAESDVDTMLAYDYWKNVIVENLDTVAHKAAEELADVNLNEIRTELSEQIINDVFAEVILPKATLWVNQIKSGENVIFRKGVIRIMNKISKEVAKKWATVIAGQPILEDLPAPEAVDGTDVMSPDLAIEIVAQAPGVSADIMIGAGVGMAFGATLGAFLAGPIGAIVGGAVGAILGAARNGAMSREARVQFIEKELKKQLTESVNNKEAIDAIVSKQAKRIETLRLGIIERFRDEFRKPQEILRERENEARELYSRQSSARAEIAKAHGDFRLTKLAPLREEISSFMKRISEDIKKEGR